MAIRRVLPVLLLLALLAGAWIGWTALQARGSLERARLALPGVQTSLSDGDTAGATSRLAQVRTDADDAYDRTHDPVWAVAAAVPLLGEPLATVRGITGAVQALTADGLPALVVAAPDLQPDALRPAPDRFDVARLSRAAGPLRTAAGSLAAQREAVAGTAPSWVPQVADARDQLLDQLTPLASSSRNASIAAQVLPPMLGGDGPRTYFLGFQNPAEARGTGGLLGAFAIVTADKGRVAVGRLGANYQLPDLPAQVPGLDDAFFAQYGQQGAADLWVNSNLSPDFPEVARTWLAMWRAGTGKQLDGALAMDPPALAALVRATGPLQVPGVGQVSAEQVEPLVLVEQYKISQDVNTRRDAMVGVGSAAIDALLGGGADPRQLLEEVAKVGRGHALVSSTRPEEQALLRQAGVAGAVSDTAAPFAQAVVVNAAGGKLDTYLDSALDYRTTCTDGARRSVVTVRLTNGSPTSGLAPYVVQRADEPPYKTVYGQNRADLRVLVTKGAELRGATLDGKPLLAPVGGQAPAELPAGSADAFLSSTTQAGRPSYGLALELPPGTTRTLELTLAEPASGAAPVLPVQPLARPPRVTSEVSGCG